LERELGTMDIWLLHIETTDGANLSAYSTEERANYGLLAYVDEWWSKEMAADAERPDDPEERIAAYFDNTSDETAEIEKVVLDEPLAD
jgi:hypothetical protein